MSATPKSQAAGFGQELLLEVRNPLSRAGGRGGWRASHGDGLLRVDKECSASQRPRVRFTGTPVWCVAAASF
jgi:hypothetical protein